MHIYDITIAYSIVDGNTMSSGTLVVRREAQTSGKAIATVVALLDDISNFVDSDGNRYMQITQATANLVT